MKRTLPLVMVIIALVLAVLGARAISAQGKQDKYTVKVPMGSRSPSSEDTRAGR